MSASLSGLPNELISLIWSYVLAPGDVKSFALVSQTIHIIAKQHGFIEDDKRLKSDFWFFHYDGQDQTSLGAKFLEGVLLDPRRALYVQKLWIDEWKIAWDEFHYVEDPHQPYAEDTMQLFERAVKNSEFISESEAEKWISEIDEGGEEPLLALFIPLTPNLNSIELDVRGKDERYLLKMFHSIAKAPAATALSHLTNIELAHAGSRYIHHDFNWVIILSSLPSLKSINGWCIGQIEDQSELHLPVPPRWSNVKILCLHHSDIDYKRLSNYLQCVRALQKFSYTPYRSCSLFAPSQLCTALASTANSLKELQISSDYGRGSHVGSLRGFNCLTDLSTQYSMLLGYSADPDGDKLLQMLPPSIETVTLMHDGRYDVRSLRAPILGMCKIKHDRLPNLKLLRFCIDPACFKNRRSRQGNNEYAYDLETIAKLMRRCGRVGVELHISQFHCLGEKLAVRPFDR